MHVIKTYGAMEAQLHFTITSALHVSDDLHACSSFPIKETTLAVVGKVGCCGLHEPLKKTCLGKM